MCIYLVLTVCQALWRVLGSAEEGLTCHSAAAAQLQSLLKPVSFSVKQENEQDAPPRVVLRTFKGEDLCALTGSLPWGSTLNVCVTAGLPYFILRTPHKLGSSSQLLLLVKQGETYEPTQQGGAGVHLAPSSKSHFLPWGGFSRNLW